MHSISLSIFGFLITPFPSNGVVIAFTTPSNSAPAIKKGNLPFKIHAKATTHVHFFKFWLKSNKFWNFKV